MSSLPSDLVPDGARDDDGEYFFHPIPHGPGILRWYGCELGQSGHCYADKHDGCAHNWGGPHEAGVSSPAGYLMRSGPGGWDRVEDVDGRPVLLLPEHVWHCACPHHTTEGATDLLAFL